jgi:hypothetical protein
MAIGKGWQTSPIILASGFLFGCRIAGEKPICEWLN